MKLTWMRTEWGKAALTSHLFALPRKMRRFSQSIANPWIRKGGVRGVNTAPGGVMIGETRGLVHLAAKEGADIELVEEVGADVAVVILPKMQMINGAVNNAHTYKLTKGTELFNNKGNQIIDFKKVLVVIHIDFRFLEF